MTHPDVKYLFTAFNSVNFPDLFNPIWITSLVFLVATVGLYLVRTRQLHRHQPYLELYEWILWTGVIFFSLILIGAVFHFDLILILIAIPAGLAILVWVRFVRFPPILAAHESQLAKQRYLSAFRYAHPDATIRTSKKSGKRRRR